MPTSPGTDQEAVARQGTVLNEKWTLVRLLGVGGMGAVYAGRHRNGARAAIKVLHPEYSRHKEVRERFRREGYAANRVDHPGVVKVLDDDVVTSGPDAGTAYLVMELLEGESLQDRLERVTIGERDFLEFADGVLDVLSAAHECGVVHRDLKPENLFFVREGETRTRIKVLDFGLARLLDQQSIASYGMVIGTPSFMSPEQAAGKLDEVDGRTDLFALAATGFRLRTGRRIHEADDAVELVQMMARKPAPPIRSVAPDVSAPYAQVIDRALQFRREDRYPNAAAMQDDVRRAIAELSKQTVALEKTLILAPAAAPAQTSPPAKKLSEPTIELSSRDLEPPPVYGLDESIRIPKRRGGLVFLALLLCAGAGAAVFVRSRIVGGQAVPNASPPATSTIADAGTANRLAVDAGQLHLGQRPQAPENERKARSTR
jgi:serine/threonine-protein kinase